MLETVKQYVNEPLTISFPEYYERYICQVQDINIVTEVSSVKATDILSLEKLITKLHNQLLGR